MANEGSGKVALGAAVEQTAMLDMVWAVAFGKTFTKVLGEEYGGTMTPEKHAGYEAMIIATKAVVAAKDHIHEYLVERD